jgi:hypothetical protein
MTGNPTPLVITLVQLFNTTLSTCRRFVGEDGDIMNTDNTTLHNIISCQSSVTTSVKCEYTAILAIAVI